MNLPMYDKEGRLMRGLEFTDGHLPEKFTLPESLAKATWMESDESFKVDKYGRMGVANPPNIIHRQFRLEKDESGVPICYREAAAWCMI